jgi:hypothetical protein
MVTYKITNITSSLGKRNDNSNKTLVISFVDEMERKNVDLKPNETMFFTATSLPLSIQKYRMKGLVSVAEIDQKELNKEMSGIKKQNINNDNVTNNTEEEITTTTTTKKSQQPIKKVSSYKKTGIS